MNEQSQPLSTKGQYDLEKQKKERQQGQLQKSKQFKKLLLWVLILTGVAAALFGAWRALSQIPKNPPQVDVKNSCINHVNLTLHIHPHLEILVDEKAEEIPANIGIPSANCMRPLHTHDKTGTIHIEWKTAHTFLLKDLFTVWDQQFYREGYKVTMTVNGQENTDLENLKLIDKDQIVLKYQKEESNP